MIRPATLVGRRWRAGRSPLISGSQALPGNAVPDALHPVGITTQSVEDVRSQAEPGNETKEPGNETKTKARRTASQTGRNVAWQLAAVTGTIGIVLLLLMQVSALLSPQAAGDTHTLAPAPDALEQKLAEGDGGESSDGAADNLMPLPEPIPDMAFDLIIDQYAESAERFDVASSSHEPAGLTQLAAATAAGDPWDAFDRQRAMASLQMAADLLALSSRRSAVEPLPSERLELDSAPTGQSRCNIAIERHVPERGVVAQPLDYEIVVRNHGDDEVPQVNIDELVPHSHRIRQTVPTARLAGQTLSWQLREIAPREERRLHVRVVPTLPGTADAASLVEATAAVMATTRVAAPRLRLEVLAPERSTVGDLATLTFRVTNQGEVDADAVVLRTNLPAMFTHPLGPELDYPLGTLAAGETRETTLTALAAGTGAENHWSDVQSDGQSLDVQEHGLSVGPPVLMLRREGLKQPRVGEPVAFTNHLVNTGDRNLAGLEIVETVPEGFEVVSVADGGQFDRSSRTIRWLVDELPAGRRITRDVTLRATRPGDLRTTVTVRSEDHAEQQMQATVTARTAVLAPPAARGAWPRSSVATPWPRSMPAFPPWQFGIGSRSGCAP